MPEPYALTCDSCAEPMLPTVSQADADGHRLVSRRVLASRSALSGKR